VTWQLLTDWQLTEQEPVHSMSHELTLEQVMRLPAPTRAAHSGVLLQSH
jgi:hypothetical protein